MPLILNFTFFWTFLKDSGWWEMLCLLDDFTIEQCNVIRKNARSCSGLFITIRST